MNDSLKKSTVKGAIWGTLERFSGQGVQFVVMLIMARLLTPKDYGLVGMVSIFVSISQTIIDSGFSQALIRKKNRTGIDNSTAFYFNIFVGFFLYLLLYIISPFVADFYNEPQLKSLMRCICLVILINSFAIVQIALYTSRIDFKTQAKATFTAAAVSGCIGIFGAIKGWGVWAIVCQHVMNSFIYVSLLWIFSNWRPSLVFSKQSFSELFSFGSKILFGGIINNIYMNLYQLVIGKVFTANLLGHYTRANQFASLPSSNISGILQRVTYPVLCQVQNDYDSLSNIYRKFVRISCFIIFPLMTILAGLSKPIVFLLIGEKWDICASLLLYICLAQMWYPIHHLNVNVLQAIGRSDCTLRIEWPKKCIGVLLMIVTIPFGIEAMCIGGIISSIVSLYINSYYVNKLLHISLFLQLKDIMPTFFLSFGIFAFLRIIQTFLYNDFAILLICGTISVILYFGFAYIFNLQELKDLLALLGRKKNN